MSLEQYKTQVLLLHSQQSTLDTLSAGFNDRYSVHCATSGTEALNTLGDTPIHVIVSAQNLPGMSGLEALREAKKRSPDTIGILLAGTDKQDGLEALVGDQEVFQIVRGAISPEALIELIESANKRVRLMALSESANDQKANVDEPVTEHIVMETSENGSAIISDGTGTLPTLKPARVDLASGVGGREVDVLVLTQDEEFLSTVRDSARGLHNVYHSVTPAQAEEIVQKNNVGVLVTDAAMVGSKVEELTQRLRTNSPRVVAIVAGRRDDGELLMDLINRGHVYRFLLKPVSPGRARLAIEASVKHHMEAPDDAFKPKSQGAPAKATPKAKAKARPPVKAVPKPAPVAKPKPKPQPAPKPEAKAEPAPPVRKAPPPPTKKAPRKIEPTISATPADGQVDDAPIDDELDQAFGETGSFTQTMTGIASSVGKSISAATGSISAGSQGMLDPSLDSPLDSSDELSPGTNKTKLLAIGGAGVAIVGVLAWVLLSGGSDPDVAVTDQASARTETPPDNAQPNTSVTETALPPTAITESAGADTSFATLLEQARAARDAGNLVTPAGSSAVEYFIEAAAVSNNDPVVIAELEDVVAEVVGLAENAILARNVADAENALDMVRLADPGNARLAFLGAQLNELQLRDRADRARVAIREGRYEDAATLIAEARAMPGNNLTEINLLTEELNSMRAQQEVGVTIDLANQRLEEGNLVSPANDNARFHFNSVLASDPANQAAQQGLVAVGSKLVLQARDAIDGGQLDTAEALLSDARSVDPNSGDLTTAANALADAREAVAVAARQAEADRQAELEREAELERQAAAAAQQAEVQDEVAGEVASDTSTTPPQTADTTTAAAVASAKPDALVGNGAATFGLPAATTDGVQAEAEQQTAPQETSAAASTAAAGSAQEPELVSVSQLTRTNYVGPEYPRGAQRRGVTGLADVTFTVTTEGRVSNPSIINSEPGTTFDQAALDAVSQWRFEPVIENGVAVEKRSAVRLAFNLQ